MSRITITADEAEKLAGEIAAVLTYASSLQEIAKNAQKIAHPDAVAQAGVNVMRDDVALPEDAQVLLAQAPEREGDYFVVPRIIKQD